jgi:hypothetical protein
MKVFVVHRSVGGYAREDASSSDVVGVYTDGEVARKIALLARGQCKEVEVDYIMPYFINTASEFGMTL